LRIARKKDLTTRRFLSASLALLLCAGFTTLSARSRSSARPTHIRIPLWVDPAPAELTAKDLTASLSGKAAPITGIQTPSSDLIILLVLDLTGDIALVDPARQALIKQVKALPPNAWVGLLRAQDGLSVLADPTPNRKTIADAIQALPVSGKAGLLDTVNAIAGLADGIVRKSNVRVAILYVTDSDITNYREDFTNPVINSSDPHDLSRRFPEALIQEKISSLQTQIAAGEAPLFIVHLQYRSSRLNQAYQNGLETLAEFTAGYGSFCRSQAEIPVAIGKAFTYMRSAWFLTIGLPEREHSAVQVRLELANHGDVHLAYRARLSLKRK